MVMVPLRYQAGKRAAIRATVKLASFCFIISFLSAPVMALGQTEKKETKNDNPFKREEHHYEIVYHWGIIWKKAADAVLTLDTIRGNKKQYKAQLTARTYAFADKIYRVRDTLYVYMNEDFRPTLYAKNTNEENVYRKDILTYKYDPKSNTTHGKTILYRPHKNSIDTVSVSSQERALDMMSLFYYMRSLDLENAKMYQRFPVKIFSGRNIEHLNIEYQGRTLYTMHKSKKQMGAYKLGLRFSINDGTEETENISVLVSDDESRIPLLMEGKLTVGSVKAIYIGSK